MKTDLEFTFRGWVVSIDFGCWFTTFYRGESGWWLSIGPILIETPDFADWPGN